MSTGFKIRKCFCVSLAFSSCVEIFSTCPRHTASILFQKKFIEDHVKTYPGLYAALAFLCAQFLLNKTIAFSGLSSQKFRRSLFFLTLNSVASPTSNITFILPIACCYFILSSSTAFMI